MMLRKAILALAGLLALASPAAAQLTLTGVGGSGSNASYSAGGVYLDGGLWGELPTYTKQSALTGVSDGSTGIISFWARCNGKYAASTAYPRCVLGDVMNNISQLAGVAGVGSETVSGIDVIFDTAGASAGNGSLRFSDNSSGQNQATAPQFQVTASNSITPSDAGVWNHWLIVWDHSATTFCGQIYKNGVSLGATPGGAGSGVAGFNANYSNSGGFAVGSNFAFGAASTQGDVYNGALSEVYVSFNPPSSPCSGNAIANYTVSKFYTDGKPVNFGANCATPTGSQPSVCLRWDTTGATVGNEGSAGAFTAQYAGGMSAPPIGVGKTATAPYLKYITNIPLNEVGTSVTPVWNYTPVAGDLIIIADSTIFAASGAATLTLGTANGFSQLGTQTGGGGTNFMIGGLYYKLAVGGDSLPVLTVSRAVRGNSYVLAVYGNVNQSTPFGQIGTWGNADPASVLTQTCPGFTPSQSGSLIATFGYIFKNTYTTETLTGNGSSRRYASKDYSTNGLGATFWNDYVNSGTTAVGNATVTSSTADSLGCFQFEIEHP